MPILPAQAVNQLQTATEAFLNHYVVRIFGDPTNSYVANYRLEDAGNSFRPGSVLGTHNMHATQKFNIQAGVGVGGNPVNSVWFTAHSVKMWSIGNLHAITPYTLPVAGGPSLMVTGQLSGCAFAIHDNGDGSLVVAHIQPDVNVSGDVLDRTLSAIPYWNVVYGRGDYSALRAASIVGSRNAGRWSIWAQKQDRTTGDYSIRKVKRLI
jgi:hypothetical protein